MSSRRARRRPGSRRTARTAPSGPRPGGSAGYTLLELIIVTVMLGVLAMIALPVYRNVRSDAAQAALRKQVRLLAEAQAMHFAVHDVYTADVEELDYRPRQDLELELKVGIGGGGLEESALGWAARLSDPSFDVRCAVFHGQTGPYEPADVEDRIACGVEE